MFIRPSVFNLIFFILSMTSNFSTASNLGGSGLSKKSITN